MISVFGAGVGTIPWLLLGELCPSKVKGIASGVTVSVAFVMIFAVVKIFPYGLEYLSPAGTYGFFAGVSENQTDIRLQGALLKVKSQTKLNPNGRFSIVTKLSLG